MLGIHLASSLPNIVTLSYRATAQTKMFHQSSVLGLAALVTGVVATAVNENCDALASAYPDKTFFPGSARYKFENECRDWPRPFSFSKARSVLLTL